jgi:YHS domain-containing protein
MKHLLILVAAFSFITGFASAAEPANKSCPISGKPVDASQKSTFTKTVALCCNKCKAQFDANPKGYLSNILASHSGQCPLSKKAITTPVNVTYKREVSFCCADCKSEFDAAPEKHIKNVR